MLSITEARQEETIYLLLCDIYVFRDIVRVNTGGCYSQVRTEIAVNISNLKLLTPAVFSQLHLTVIAYCIFRNE